MHDLPLAHLRFSRPCHRSGSTLAATMVIIAVVVTLLSLSALLTSQFGRFTGRQQGNNDLMAAADAGLEYAYAEWQASIRKGNTAAVSVSNLNSATLPFAANGIVFNSLTISPADQNGLASGTATGTATSNVPGYPGWSGTTKNYLATVAVTYTTAGLHYGFSSDGIPVVKTSRVFQYTQVPLFQAAIFYENKLEIHPGADMVVNGLVHTNGDLWARGFSTLQFKSNVSYVNSYHEIGDATITKGWDGNGGGYIPGVGPFAGVPLVTWSDGQTSNTSTAKATQLNQVNPIDPFGGLTSSGNGLHQLIEVPTASTPPAIAAQAAYTQSSVVITIDSSQPANSASRVTVTDNQGNALDQGDPASSKIDTAAIMNAVNNGATTSIFDQREGVNSIVTNLDMAKLAAATVVAVGKTATLFQSSFNGTVYIHDVSKATATQPAIRLINGANLGQNVTVASDNGVYIQGDYNTGVATASNPVPSDAAGATTSANPQINGYSRYSSAVMADAVTILSNNWSDSNANQALSKRTATATTVNTAIMSGDVPSDSTAGTASGGAHNFPRFLENWNNINFTYWGSLVEAFKSDEFTGGWQTGQVYYWPNRLWNFDTNFTNNPPPGTANGVQFSRGRWQRN